jgi:Photosynthesis system II assembly factor YCF48
VRAAVRAFALIASLAGSLATLHADDRWKIQYFYDQPGANFNIRDMDCPSARRCVAAGTITDRKDRQQGAVVVSSDGGAHWSLYEVKEQPISMFFLDETLGWMVTDHGLWSTVEGGRNWTKVENRKAILLTYFLDAKHGYITGESSLFAETMDGGKTWTERPEASKSENLKAVTYNSITFLGKHGVVVGEVDPNAPGTKFAKGAGGLLPGERSAIVIETLDGGATWNTNSLSLGADLSRLRISKQGFVLSLIAYSDPRIQLASAVFQTPLGQAGSRMVFGERDRAVTDIEVLDDGSGIVVAVEPPGNSPAVPIPGKVKILKSQNLKVWQEMEVDYRAVAQEALIAVADARHMWVATDTGAILGLVSDP